eukprot:263214-Hanusia_phi.AAC.10
MARQGLPLSSFFSSSFLSSLFNLQLLNDLKYLHDFSNQIFQNALEVHGTQVKPPPSSSLSLLHPSCFPLSPSFHLSLLLPVPPTPEIFQILLDGAFSGDPHPGNILISPSGALELIDFGQVKRLSEVQRRDLASMILLLADGKLEDAQTLFVRMGFRTKK